METNSLNVTILVHADDFVGGEDLARAINDTYFGIKVQLADFRTPLILRDDPDAIIILLTNRLEPDGDLLELLDRIADSPLSQKVIFATTDGPLLHEHPLISSVIDLSAGRAAVDQIISGVLQSNSSRQHVYQTYKVVPAMLGRVADLPVMGRTKSILCNQNLIYVGDLVQHTEAELLRIQNFGRKTLNDVKIALTSLGLRLGMTLIGWPPEDFETAEYRLEVAQRLAALEQSSSGAMFEPADDHFAMLIGGEQKDLDAALKPMSRQMQSVLHEKASRFAGLAARLDNQPGWTGIARAASSLADLIERPAEEIPDILGYLYPTALELGSFVELDQQLVAGAESYASPLDPEIRRPLTDLVRSLAPWLRAFPSIRDADDEASRFLVKISEPDTAAEIARSARDHALLTERDFQIFQQLQAASERGVFQGEKAASRAKRSASNLVISAAAFAGGFLVSAISSDYATTSPLVHRVGQFLVQTEVAISVLVADLPNDLKFAISDLVKDMRHHPQSPPPSRPGERPEAPIRQVNHPSRKRQKG